MKAIFQPLVVLLMSYVLFGCSKSSKEESVTVQNDLSADTNFIKIVNLEEALNNFVIQMADQKGVSIQSFKLKIQDLADKDLYSNKGSQLLNEYMGTENIEYLKNYVHNYHSSWIKLNAKFNNISMQNINEACKNLYIKRFNSYTGNISTPNSVFTNSMISVNKENECGWRYYLCMAAATASGILCHAGCVGATAGLGTPACVILCSTIETAAGVLCTDNYCPIP